MEMKEDFSKVKMAKGKRFYSQKSYRWMTQTRVAVLVVFAPLWLPLYLLLLAMTFGVEWLENLLGWADDLLQKILDKVIPQKW